MEAHPLIVANWKMNTTLADAIVAFEAIKIGLEPLDDVKVVVCPPFPWLAVLAEKNQERPIRHLSIGSQNVSQFVGGAYTGEVSASMLKNIVDYAIVGHSERVAHFHELPAETNQKIKLLLKNKITPIVCVGEKYKNKNSIQQVLETTAKIFKDLSQKQIQASVIAYEPVWAISSNPHAEPTTGDYAEKVAHTLALNFKTKIIYGGSVNAKNIREFTIGEHIAGALVGKSSLSAREFIQIIKKA